MNREADDRNITYTNLTVRWLNWGLYYKTLWITEKEKLMGSIKEKNHLKKAIFSLIYRRKKCLWYSTCSFNFFLFLKVLQRRSLVPDEKELTLVGLFCILKLKQAVHRHVPPEEPSSADESNYTSSIQDLAWLHISSCPKGCGFNPSYCIFLFYVYRGLCII